LIGVFTALVALIVLQLAGEVIVYALMLPVPGPVVGLVLLYAGLVARGGVPDNLRVTSDTLLQHLMLFLVPATTGLILHLQRLGNEWLPIILAAVGGTAVTMVVTAATLRLVAKRARVP